MATYADVCVGIFDEFGERGCVVADGLVIVIANK